jgi:hypothetical protein
MSAVLMGDGNRIKFGELDKIPVPKSTHSWSPIAWKGLVQDICRDLTIVGYRIDHVDLMVSGFDKQTGLPGELYGTFVLEGGDGETVPQLALRTSYNMKYATAICGGMHVLVCSNGMFCGEYQLVMRKQTTFANRDIKPLIRQGVSRLQAAYDNTRQHRDLLQSVPLSLDEGYALIGQAVGHSVITPTMANVAYGDWRKPRHEEHGNVNAWGLYNCFTEGAKKTRAGNLLTAHTSIDSFFRDKVKARDSVHYEQEPFDGGIGNFPDPLGY